MAASLTAARKLQAYHTDDKRLVDLADLRRTFCWNTIANLHGDDQHAEDRGAATLGNQLRLFQDVEPSRPADLLQVEFTSMIFRSSHE
jgi:hypothetical protein